MCEDTTKKRQVRDDKQEMYILLGIRWPQSLILNPIHLSVQYLTHKGKWGVFGVESAHEA